MLAANNHPRKLILQAPYYCIKDWILNLAPDFDTSLINFRFDTYKLLPKIAAPIIVFHGDAGEGIYYGSSLKLKSLFKNLMNW